METSKPRCQAKRKDGQPCHAFALNGHQFCVAHAPHMAEARQEAWARGGRNRSNAARAAREIEAIDIDASVSDLKPILFRALRHVEDGTLLPNVANSMAGLAKAIVDVTSAIEVDERIAALEKQIATINGASIRRIA